MNSMDHDSMYEQTKPDFLAHGTERKTSTTYYGSCIMNNTSRVVRFRVVKVEKRDGGVN